MVGDPVQGRRRDDHIDWRVQVEVEDVLTPHLGAVAEPRSRECDHVCRRVDRQHAASRHERQQRLGHATRAAADIKQSGVARDAAEPGQHVRSPRLLRLA